MAHECFWYYSDLSEELVNILERDATESFEQKMKDSRLQGDEINKSKRKSQNTWIPTSHWIGGFLWHYIQKANRENFLYDLRNIDGENIQFTRYNTGEFYSWHTDCGFSTQYRPVSLSNSHTGLDNDYVKEKSELIRKLSVVVQLSHPDDYEGGNLQLLGEAQKSYIAPRKRGTIIVFDSRVQHRVLKVRKGTRKSLVCWVVGPRWK